MLFVYILYSLKDHKLYKGSTPNIQRRLLKHNSGGSKSRAHQKPFVIVHVEQFENKSVALKDMRLYKGFTSNIQKISDVSSIRPISLNQ
jgi:putative endonuclease